MTGDLSAGTLRSLCVTPELDIVVGCQDTTLKLYSHEQLGPRDSESLPCRGALPCDDDVPVAAEEPPRVSFAGPPVLTHAVSTLSATDVELRHTVVEPAVTGSVDEGHCAAVQSVVHSAKYIISAGGDCRIRVWARKGLEPVTALQGHRGPIFALLIAGARRLTQNNSALSPPRWSPRCRATAGRSLRCSSPVCAA